MRTTLPLVIPHSMYWHQAIAVSHLAAHDEAVFARLTSTIRTAEFHSATTLPTIHPSPYLIPLSLEQAERTIDWLATSLKDKPSYLAHQLLGTVATYESPKALILGIIGFATPFIDFGLITKKKKKKSELSVIVSDAWYRAQSQTNLLRFITARGLEQTSRELRSGAGQLSRLHPDTFDWVTSDREMSMYLADHAELSLVCEASTHEHLPGHRTRDTNEVIALTLSPQVNDTFLPQFTLRRTDS